VVIPRDPSIETLIEFSHRLSSGLLGILVVAFNLFAFRALPRSHPACRFAFLSLLFVVSEALIGAGLVRFEWVAANVSEARIYVMAFHLMNTFFLLAALTLAAWFAGRERPPGFRAGPGVLLACGGALAAVLLLGASGAVTALGDTLVLTAGIRPEESKLVAKLVASRFYHPTLAAMVLLVTIAVVLWLRPRTGERARRRGYQALLVFGAQMAVGAVNVLFKAPVPLQLLHLAVSDALWILLVLMSVEAFAFARSASAKPAEARRA
jgi:heme A synthase